MLVYVATKLLENGIQQYLGVSASRTRAENELKDTYPDLKRTGQYEDKYLSDESDSPETILIRGITV